MTIVVDASVLVVLASGDPRRGAAQARLRDWIGGGEDIHAPALLSYEVASGLTRLVSSGLFPSESVAEAWRTILRLPISYHALEGDGDRVVSLALEPHRKSAYDAAYVDLTEQLGAELWTFDGPLARNAIDLGFPVHLIG